MSTAPASGSHADQLMIDMAAYVDADAVRSPAAMRAARLALFDAMGCAFLALPYPECTKLLGPAVPGISARHFARVPGTRHRLDPVTAAFDIGCLIRWVDFSDTWLGAEGGHPSDNFGAVLAVADYLSRLRDVNGGEPVLLSEVLRSAAMAYEIQGIVALTNGFTVHGFDHAGLVRVASTAVATKMLGGTPDQIVNGISNAFVDGQPLRVYRQAPNAGHRKSWAGADATSRGVALALMAVKDEMGYPTALSDPKWGLYKVGFEGKPFSISRPFGSYVMENILFKVQYPGCVHGQTAIEAALKLHPLVRDRLDRIATIRVWTYEWALRVVDKRGPLRNSADRDHCLRYMIAVSLLKGSITDRDFQDDVAADPTIDQLRARTVIAEDERFTREFYDPDKRSCANGIEIEFTDGSTTGRVDVEYPIGHMRRRSESTALLREKFLSAISPVLTAKSTRAALDFYDMDQDRFERTPVHRFMDVFSDLKRSRPVGRLTSTHS